MRWAQLKPWSRMPCGPEQSHLRRCGFVMSQFFVFFMSWGPKLLFDVEKNRKHPLFHVIPCYSMLFPIWLRTPKKSELDSLKMFTHVHKVTNAYKCHDGQDGCPPKRKDVHLLLQGLCFWMFFLDRGAWDNTWKPTDEPREMFVRCWH